MPTAWSKQNNNMIKDLFTIKNFRRWLILTLCISFVSACAAGPVTPTAPALKPVTLQLQWVTQSQFAGYYVALDKGWYRDEGIELTIKPGGPDTLASDAVTAGSAQFGTSLLADIIVAIEQGKPLLSIGQIQQTNGLVLLAQKASGIQEPKEFAGRRVGVWLGNWEAQFDALMAKENLAPEDYILVAQGFSMEPFLEGQLDVASAMIYNEYHSVLESGVKPEDLNIIDYADYGLDFPGDTLFTTRELAEKDPALVTAMLRASLRGWQYAVEHPEEAADIVLKYDKSGVQTREHQLTMMNEIAKLVQMGVREIGYTDRTDVQRTLDTLLQYEVLKRPVKSEEVYTNAFWEQARK